MTISNTIKAFTLIELLVVIAIIGILSGMVIVSISGLQESARDSRIKSEMNQLRTVAEIYKASHSGDYTGLTGDSQVSDLLEDITLQGGTAESNLFASSNSFCVFSLLAGSDESYCIDSLGYSGTGTCTNYQCNYNESSWSGGTLAEGLVGYWTMDQSDSSGSTLFDQSPYGNNGTIYGATFATDKNGNPNSAMSFDGENDYVDIGDSASGNLDFGTGNFTISFWFKGILGDKGIVSKKSTSNGTDAGWTIYLDTPGWHLRTRLANGSNQIAVSGLKTNLNDNIWHYGTIVKSGDNLLVYTDGLIDNSTTGVSSYNVNNAINFYIGRIGSTYWNGSIGDVRIYNRALFAIEIQQLYQAE